MNNITGKLKLLNGKDFWTTYGYKEYGIKELVFSDGPTGLRFQPGENDHLGLNESCKATCFPTPSALACSWDTGLIYDVASCIAHEAADMDVDVVLAPGINIKRSPLCGRNFEYLSEDPYLTGKLGAAYVKGLQDNGIGSCIKHFAANNQEAYRMSINVLADKRALFEIYLKAFKMIIDEARPWTIMSAYNRLLGDYCSENEWLLSDLLRNKWGYDGLVVSDWSAVNDIVKSINSGLDLEMPSMGSLSLGLLEKEYADGSLSKAAVDRAVENLKRLSQRCTNSLKKHVRSDLTKHHQIAHKAAAESFVLLKNEKNALPLSKSERLLFVGELMNSPIIQGHGSSRVNAAIVDSIPAELTSCGLNYVFEPGYTLNSPMVDPVLQEKALAAASKADKIIVFAGLFDNSEAESYDRDSLRLPQCQNELICRLAELGKQLIVVLQTGSAVEMPWIDHVDSVLQMHLSGQGGGKALPEILSGRSNPCGKLTESYPLKLSHTPSYLFSGSSTQVAYSESIFVGYRYYDKKDMEVLFPFGHGLSYTSFAYDSFKVEETNDGINISVRITNTGSYEGKEIVQLYTCLNNKIAIQPGRQLAAFKKVALKPGESTEVLFTLRSNDFMYYDEVQKDFVYATGKNAVEMGRSSRSIEFRHTIEIKENNRKYPRITSATTIGELQSIPPLKEPVEAWLGALLEQAGLNSIEAINVKEIEKSTFYMPLRSAVQISCGEFSFSELDNLIAILNHILEENGLLL